MTIDDIIPIAIKAGFTEGDWLLFPDVLKRFAIFIAEAEREECIQIVHDTYEGFGASAQGVNFVKQRIMEEIRARGQHDTR